MVVDIALLPACEQKGVSVRPISGTWNMQMCSFPSMQGIHICRISHQEYPVAFQNHTLVHILCASSAVNNSGQSITYRGHLHHIMGRRLIEDVPLQSIQKFRFFLKARWPSSPVSFMQMVIQFFLKDFPDRSPTT